MKGGGAIYRMQHKYDGVSYEVEVHQGEVIDI